MRTWHEDPVWLVYSVGGIEVGLIVILPVNTTCRVSEVGTLNVCKIGIYCFALLTAKELELLSFETFSQGPRTV